MSTVPFASGTLVYGYCSTSLVTPTGIQFLYGVATGVYTCTHALATTCGAESVRSVFPTRGTYYGVTIATDGGQYWACSSEEVVTLSGRSWSVQ